MANLIANVQERFKTSTNALALLGFKILSVFFVGLTIALVGQEVIQYEVFSFVLVVVVMMATLLRIVRAWTWTNIMIFDLVCILVGMLLRMYILIAPSA